LSFYKSIKIVLILVNDFIRNIGIDSSRKLKKTYYLSQRN
jgi:hypothetical protein